MHQFFFERIIVMNQLLSVSFINLIITFITFKFSKGRENIQKIYIIKIILNSKINMILKYFLFVEGT